MTVLLKLAPNQEAIEAIWPSFKVNIEEKHGSSGQIGQRGETAAIELLKNHFQPKCIIDHSQDVVGQLLGIDLTVVHPRGVMTVDVKSGSTSLYYDRELRSWYIGMRADWFLPSKRNEYIMHVGPKGDRFCLYKKDKMKDFLRENFDPADLFNGVYDEQKLHKADWPGWIINNFT